MKSLNNEVNEQELLRLAQTGDAAAEEALIRSYKQDILSKARLYFIVGADSEDIVQEGMIGIFKAIHSYDASKETSFRTYADICITRQILSAVRTAARKKHAPLNESLSIDMPLNDNTKDDYTLADTLPASYAEDPESVLIMKENLDFMDSDAFSDLELAVLNEYLMGKNYNDIAEVLGKTPKAVDNALQRIKRKLQKYWED